jgi:hypothetical protein
MYYGLLRLGFKDSDFELRDDSDGKGAYIDAWRSDKPQPSASEIQTAQDEYQAEYDNQEYARNRKTEYPDIGDQLDAIWKGGEEADAMKIIVNQVKAKYPKE